MTDRTPAEQDALDRAREKADAHTARERQIRAENRRLAARNAVARLAVERGLTPEIWSATADFDDIEFDLDGRPDPATVTTALQAALDRHPTVAQRDGHDPDGTDSGGRDPGSTDGGGSGGDRDARVAEAHAAMAAAAGIPQSHNDQEPDDGDQPPDTSSRRQRADAAAEEMRRVL